VTQRTSSILETATPPVGSPSGLRSRRSLLGQTAYLRDVTLHLVRRDFTTRHRGSLLGWLWALAPALLQLGVTFFVFTKVLGLHQPNYPVFLLTGILAWNWFARSLLLGVYALEGRRELAMRPGFPMLILPVSAALIGLLDYVITLPVLLIAIAVGPGLHPSALMLPVPVLIQLVLSVGLCWILAPLQVYYRDVGHFVGIAVLLGFWITPIWYTRDKVPSEFMIIYRLNPMTHLIEAQRALLLEGKLPTAQQLGFVAIGAVVTTVLGYILLTRLRDSVPERM